MLYHSKCSGKLDLKGDRDYFVRNLFLPQCPRCKEYVSSENTIPCIKFCDAITSIKMISPHSDQLAQMIINAIGNA